MGLASSGRGRATCRGRSAILIVSAHWESAPLTIGSTATGTPLIYDFWGFPQRYYDVTYDSPGAPALAAPVEALMPDTEPVAQRRQTAASTTAPTCR